MKTVIENERQICAKKKKAEFYFTFSKTSALHMFPILEKSSQYRTSCKTHTMFDYSLVS